ncbi:MAG: flagellar hook-associated protein FlgK [Gammaproteobacteria bacterium]|nr:flagellar hook-associated protein FlgK [Gammaproteobacteria bacterium]
MADFISTSVSGLSSVQRALDVLSHNITNAYAEGFSRQTVSLITRPAQETGQGAIGSGVRIANIARTFDQFLGQTLQSAMTEQGRLAARQDVLGMMDDLIGGQGGNLNAWMTDFFNAAHDVANNPADLAVRTTFLGQATLMTQRMQSLDRQLGSIDQRIAQRATQMVQDINGMTRELADLNARILDMRNRFPGHEPNDLLDRRDLVLRNLSSKLDVQTYEDERGNVQVNLSNGLPLVLADRNMPLGVMVSGTQLAITFNDMDVTAYIGSGELGGLLQVKHDALDPLRAQLGRAAFSLAQRINEVHRQGEGLDSLDGTADGRDLFKAPVPGGGSANYLALHAFIGADRVEPSASGVTVAIEDVTQLNAHDFALRYEGEAWKLYRLGEAQPMQTVVPGVIDLTSSEGIKIDASSLPATPGVGQPRELILRPMGGVLASLSLAIQDPRQIAAALPGGGVGDNRNMLALASIASAQDVVGGVQSLSGAFTQVQAAFGSLARANKVSLDAQEIVVKQIRDRRESIVGVNLDEEAAHLMRLQNHYMALSKSLSVADNLFQSLLQAAS